MEGEFVPRRSPDDGGRPAARRLHHRRARAGLHGQARSRSLHLRRGSRRLRTAVPRRRPSLDDDADGRYPRTATSGGYAVRHRSFGFYTGATLTAPGAAPRGALAAATTTPRRASSAVGVLAAPRWSSCWPVRRNAEAAAGSVGNAGAARARQQPAPRASPRIGQLLLLAVTRPLRPCGCWYRARAGGTGRWQLLMARLRSQACAVVARSVSRPPPGRVDGVLRQLDATAATSRGLDLST
jgi:hypothetical protein